jgi:hypothetical protein
MADRNGYIGRAPSDSSVTVARQTFSPTGVTTDFTFASGYTSGFFDIFINGVKMIEGSDYTSTDGSTFSILNGGADNGDVIEAVAYKAFNAATATVGVSSAGTSIGSVNTLNFVGTGNTFALRGTSVDISISGGGAGAGGTWANYDTNTGVSTTKKVKIENDLEVTGVTTSTGGFVGNVTGTATGLSGSPNITINNLTGVAATFTGVLTYEDVTNVDSLGIVTARGGLEVGASGVGGTITAAGAAVFSGIVTTTEFLHVLGAAGASEKGIEARSNSTQATDTNKAIRVRNNSDTDTFNVSYRGAATFGGDLTIPDKIIHDGDTNTSIRFPAADTFTVETSGSERLRITSVGEVRVGSAFSVSQAGVCTAAEFHGDGSNLTNLPAAGFTTEAFTSSGIVTAVRLGTALDHKITATGFTTITSSGSGTEGESHTIRIVNSGIATVGFSTYFLFPSGAAPSMPTADGAVSLISFTVHDSVGAGCTQLLAGASVNFS